MKERLKILFIGIMIITLTGCGTSIFEIKKITNNAINYFTNKYNIDKKDIKIIDNRLYGNNESCIDSCGENELIINYKNKEYTIRYNNDANFFGDNYQYDEVYTDLLNYLNNKFKFANKIKVYDSLEADVMGTSEKYNGNIKEYYNKIKNFYSNHKYIYSEDGLIGDHIYTDVGIWIEAKTPEEAKRLNKSYSKEIIKELESLGVSYHIDISVNSDDNDYSAFYYHVYDEEFYLTDKVDNQQIHCERNDLQDGMCN